MAVKLVVGFRRYRANLDILVQSAANEKLDLNAAILLAAFAGRVVGNSLKLAESERLTNAAKRYIVSFDQIVDNRLRATLAEPFVHLRSTFRRSKTGDLDLIALEARSCGRNL